MVISGILGVWLHILIDAAYHFDVKIFWPNKTISLWWAIRRHVSAEQVENICLILFIAAVIPYLIAVASYRKHNKIEKDVPGAG